MAEYKVNLNARDLDGRTPLQIAQKHEKEAVRGKAASAIAISIFGCTPQDCFQEVLTNQHFEHP